MAGNIAIYYNYNESNKLNCKKIIYQLFTIQLFSKEHKLPVGVCHFMLEVHILLFHLKKKLRMVSYEINVVFSHKHKLYNLKIKSLHLSSVALYF